MLIKYHEIVDRYFCEINDIQAYFPLNNNTFKVDYGLNNNALKLYFGSTLL